MANPLQSFRKLLPRSPLLAGTVRAVTGSDCRIECPDGTLHTARGSAAVDDVVYFRPGGAIEGEAPGGAVVDIEVF